MIFLKEQVMVKKKLFTLHFILQCICALKCSDMYYPVGDGTCIIPEKIATRIEFFKVATHFKQVQNLQHEGSSEQTCESINELLKPFSQSKEEQEKFFAEKSDEELYLFDQAYDFLQVKKTDPVMSSLGKAICNPLKDYIYPLKRAILSIAFCLNQREASDDLYAFINEKYEQLIKKLAERKQFRLSPLVIVNSKFHVDDLLQRYKVKRKGVIFSWFNEHFKEKYTQKKLYKKDGNTTLDLSYCFIFNAQCFEKIVNDNKKFYIKNLKIDYARNKVCMNNIRTMLPCLESISCQGISAQQDGLDSFLLYRNNDPDPLLRLYIDKSSYEKIKEYEVDQPLLNNTVDLQYRLNAIKRIVKKNHFPKSYQLSNKIYNSFWAFHFVFLFPVGTLVPCFCISPSVINKIAKYVLPFEVFSTQFALAGVNGFNHLFWPHMVSKVAIASFTLFNVVNPRLIATIYKNNIRFFLDLVEVGDVFYYISFLFFIKKRDFSLYDNLYYYSFLILFLPSISYITSRYGNVQDIKADLSVLKTDAKKILFLLTHRQVPQIISDD